MSGDLEGRDIIAFTFSDWHASWSTPQQIATLEAELAKLRAGQKPVAAQVRFRRPEKGLADWSIWQQTTIKPNMPAWSIDSAGYEVEYRLLYATSQPSAAQGVNQQLLEALNGMLLHIREPESESEFQWPEHFKKQKVAFVAARAAIAAARKGGV